MGVRANTLGKGAIVNMQLNKAYDVVEYVALNLPLIAELSKKLTLYTESDKIVTHMGNTTLHFSKEEKEFLTNLMTKGAITKDSLQLLQLSIENLQTQLENHTEENIHLTDAQKELLSKVATNYQYYPTSNLHTVAISGDFNDLVNVPSFATPSDVESLQNAIKDIKIPTDYLKRADVDEVAISGSYKDLKDKPVIDTSISEFSANAASSSAVYAAIQNIPSKKVKYNEILGIPLVDNIPTEGSNNLVTSNGIFESIRDSIDTITEEDIDTIIGGE